MYVIKHGTPAQCQRWAKQINDDPALKPEIERLRKVYHRDDYQPAQAHRYEGKTWCISVDLTDLLCGYLGTRGYRHIYDHGQGYGDPPARTRALERCEQQWHKFAASGQVVTEKPNPNESECVYCGGPVEKDSKDYRQCPECEADLHKSCYRAHKRDEHAD